MERKQAILLVDHGSRKKEANDSLQQVAEMVRAKVPAEVPVCIAHMELAEPGIGDGFRACVDTGAQEVIVHPYMLSRGRHVQQDIPRLVEQAASDHPGIRYTITEPLGLHPLLADVIASRCGFVDGLAIGDEDR